MTDLGLECLLAHGKSLTSTVRGKVKLKASRLFCQKQQYRKNVLKLYLPGIIVFGTSLLNAQSKLSTKRAYKAGEVDGVLGVNFYIGPSKHMTESSELSPEWGDLVPGWMVQTLKANDEGTFETPSLVVKFEALQPGSVPEFHVAFLTWNPAFSTSGGLNDEVVELTRLPLDGEHETALKRTAEEVEEEKARKKRKQLAKHILQ